MAKLNWNRPRSTVQTWAYIPTPATRRHTKADWQQANIKRQIADLDARIRSGMGWLATIPRKDARYPAWSCKVAELRLKRARLQRQIDQAK